MPGRSRSPPGVPMDTEPARGRHRALPAPRAQGVGQPVGLFSDGSLGFRRRLSVERYPVHPAFRSNTNGIEAGTCRRRHLDRRHPEPLGNVVRSREEVTSGHLALTFAGQAPALRRWCLDSAISARPSTSPSTRRCVTRSSGKSVDRFSSSVAEARSLAASSPFAMAASCSKWCAARPKAADRPSLSSPISRLSASRRLELASWYATHSTNWALRALRPQRPLPRPAQGALAPAARQAQDPGRRTHREGGAPDRVRAGRSLEPSHTCSLSLRVGSRSSRETEDKQWQPSRHTQRGRESATDGPARTIPAPGWWRWGASNG